MGLRSSLFKFMVAPDTSEKVYDYSFVSLQLPTTVGYDGSPFIWDEEERRHLRARLDALYFHLYGLSRDDAEYVLDTFPIVRREDESTCGTYRTCDMTLAYMNALAAGDTETRVAV